MVEVLLFDEQVNVHRPDINPFGIITQNTLKHCLASFSISILELILGKLHDHINICTARTYGDLNILSYKKNLSNNTRLTTEL